MDKSIIRDFAKLRVLTPYDVQRMDDLVQDLTNALEESSSSNIAVLKQSKHQRRRRGGTTHKRRPLKLSSSPAGLVGFLSPPRTTADILLLASEDSISSLDETGTGKSPAGDPNAHQSDSDCLVSGSRPILVRSLSQGMGQKSCFPVGSFAESDSVNENFSPVRPHRRKRKFKRMAVDPSLGLGSDPAAAAASSRLPSELLAFRLLHTGHKTEKSRFLLHRGDLVKSGMEVNVLRSPILTGKRKHSMRERSVELLEGDIGVHMAGKNLGSMVIFDTPSLDENDPDDGGGGGSLEGEAACGRAAGTMDLCEEGPSHKAVDSSSSLSSSESDAGIYTNDEGREGDDEHSDFYHEGGPACGIPGVLPWWENGHDLEMDEEERASRATFESILTGTFKHVPPCEETGTCRNPICHLPVMTGREIRAGRRRLRDRRPGFSIISSMNEKISKFLQNPDQNELKLCPMKKKEMDQLVHLASLYSLNMHSEGSNQDIWPVLTKTRNTTQVVNLDKIGVTNLWNRTVVSEIKRQRRTPPTSPGTEDLAGEKAEDESIPEHNIGNVMLQDMGWEPGTGLGAKQDGIRMPVLTHSRPRYQGLGFGPSTSK